MVMGFRTSDFDSSRWRNSLRKVLLFYDDDDDDDFFVMST